MKNQISSKVQEFLHTESSGGIVLLVAACLAMIWANSPFAFLYEYMKTVSVQFSVGGIGIDKNLLLLVNDGLMVIFFYLIGLELKKELTAGELSSPSKASFSIFAAIGGMLVPALFYVAFNYNDPAALRGWGVPMATDIAFAVGILALIPGVPKALKVFLLALAIVDDLGAILVIAFFYTSKVSAEWLGVAAGSLGLLFLMGKAGMRHLVVGLTLGLITWFAFLKSGVHATIAGVLLAFLTPTQFAGKKESGAPFIDHWIHALHPWVAFFVIPVFAIFNAGVTIDATASAALLSSKVALGIFLGLVIGKPIGVTALAWMADRVGLCKKPAEIRWIEVAGVGCLAGIGFTMSIFINGLAFQNPQMADVAKLGILGASVVAAIIGYSVLRSSVSAAPEPQNNPKKSSLSGKPAEIGAG